jgi:hypothetical protein
MRHIGVMRVYHATNLEAGLSIMRDRTMKPGVAGLFGAGIYFAEKPEFAIGKAAGDGSQRGAIVIVTVLADFGHALQIEGTAYGMTGAILKGRGCQSLVGRSGSQAPWEYVLYDASRITALEDFTVRNAAQYPQEATRVQTALATWRGVMSAQRSDRAAADVQLVRGRKTPSDHQRVPENLDVRGNTCPDCELHVCYQVSKDFSKAIYDCCYMVDKLFDDDLTGQVNPYHPHDLASGQWNNFTPNPVLIEHQGRRAPYTSVETVFGNGPPLRCLYFSRANPWGKLPIVEFTASRTAGSPPASPIGWEFICHAGTDTPANFYRGNPAEAVYLAFRRG